MIGRRCKDGYTLMAIAPAELQLMLSSLQERAAYHFREAATFDIKARDHRELADTVKHGAHANQRRAGELESEAARHKDLSHQALDMVRVLRPLLAPSRSSLVESSQIEGGSHVEE